jgi:hypothetical protein
MRDMTFKDAELNAFARLDNPDRTIGIINHLRKQQGLPPYFPSEINISEPASRWPEGRIEPPPELPSQGIGPIYLPSQNGVIDATGPQTLYRNSNNIPRLRVLHGPLRDMAHDLQERMTTSLNSYPALFTAIVGYAAALAKQTDEVDFTAIYAFGLRLDAAVARTRQSIENGNLPPLDEDQSEMLRSMRMMHGPFVLASKEGRDLVADAERYNLTGPERVAFQKEVFALGEAIEKNPDVATLEVANDIAENAQAITDGPQEARASNLTLHQVAIFAVSAGEVSIATLLGMHIGSDGLVVLGGVWAYLGSRPEGRQALRTARDIHATLHRNTVDYLNYAVPKFLLKTEGIWRRLAALSPRLSFVEGLIDWISKQRGAS